MKTVQCRAVQQLPPLNITQSPGQIYVFIPDEIRED